MVVKPLFGAVLAALLLAGCGTSAPPPRLVQMPLDAPGANAVPTMADAAVWDVADDVRLPAYLDRESVVLVGADGQVQRLERERWAEPLRDTVPRLLRLDLAQLRGSDRVWLAPAPPGVAAVRRLRVEVLALQADSARGTVRLDARWTLVDLRGTAPPLTGSADLRVTVAGGGAEGIAVAHRAAIRQLAERIAASR